MKTYDQIVVHINGEKAVLGPRIEFAYYIPLRDEIKITDYEIEYELDIGELLLKSGTYVKLGTV